MWLNQFVTGPCFIVNQCIIYCRSWTCWLCPRCDPQRSRRMRLPPRFPTNPLTRRRHRIRNGHTPHLQNPRRVSGSYDEHLLSRTQSQSQWHSGRTLQRYPIRPPTGRKHRRDFLHRQRGFVRYLLQNSKTYNTNVWRSEPFGVLDHVGSHDMLAFSWSIECGSQKTCCQHGAFSTITFLYTWICTLNFKR